MPKNQRIIARVDGHTIRSVGTSDGRVLRIEGPTCYAHLEDLFHCIPRGWKVDTFRNARCERGKSMEIPIKRKLREVGR